MDDFGVQGARFYGGFYARQCVHILMQTYQAFQLSGSITSPTINGFVVGIIVTNCLYTSVIDKVVGQKPAPQRVARVTIDLLLDFTISVIVPIVICIPHALEFDWVAFVYPDDLVFNEIWLSNTVTEVRQIMVSSYPDCLSSTLLLLGGFVDLRTLKMIVHRADSRHAIVPHVATNELPSPSPPRAVTSTRASRLYRGFTTVWAVFVLSVHFASQKPIAPHCSLHINAWFSTNTSCSIAQVNCHRINSTGAQDDVALPLAACERSQLTKLVLSHCVALDVPPIVREFSGLKGFESFNNTITQWSSNAALTVNTNPKIQQIQLIATSFAAFPDALLRSDLPVPANIVIYGGNLTTLPNTIGQLWGNRTWHMLRIELTQLGQLPTSFRDLHIDRLALVGNQLAALDDDVFQNQRFQDLRLSNNTKLEVLPLSIGDTSQLSRLLLENTNVAAAPTWLVQWWQERPTTAIVSFVGSPFCGKSQLLATAAACVDGVLPAQTDMFRQRPRCKNRPLKKRFERRVLDT